MFKQSTDFLFYTLQDAHGEECKIVTKIPRDWVSPFLSQWPTVYSCRCDLSITGVWCFWPETGWVSQPHTHDQWPPLFRCNLLSQRVGMSYSCQYLITKLCSKTSRQRQCHSRVSHSSLLLEFADLQLMEKSRAAVSQTAPVDVVFNWVAATFLLYPMTVQKPARTL